MQDKIETALNAKGFIANVLVQDGYVEFNMNGAEYFAKLVRGKFKIENMRRA